MIKKLICTTLLIAGTALTTLAGPILSITPSSNNVQVGNTFSLFLNISAATDLYAWEVDIDFGPAGLMDSTVIAEGSFLGGGTSFNQGTADNGTATILALANSLNGIVPGVTGDGALAQLSFLANSIGTATVSLTRIILLDSNLDEIFPDPSVSATVNITAASGDVPEPSTFILLSLGLAAGAFLRRRA